MIHIESSIPLSFLGIGTEILVRALLAGSKELHELCICTRTTTRLILQYRIKTRKCTFFHGSQAIHDVYPSSQPVMMF